MKVPSARSYRAFTLIELLVVISIIAILMTLLFPAASSAIYAAKKTQVKNTATQIQTAISAYQADYGKLPIANGGGAGGNFNTTDLMDALCPPNPNNPPDLNPRGVTFLEIPKATKDGRNGRAEGTGPYMDAWKQSYFIVLDDDYDGIVKGPSGKEQQAEIRKSAIVYSKGDPTRTKEYDDPTKWIKSWE